MFEKREREKKKSGKNIKRGRREGWKREEKNREKDRSKKRRVIEREIAVRTESLRHHGQLHAGCRSLPNPFS